MAFTDAEKVEIRRHCGMPVFGGSPTQAFGYRFFTWYGTLEFRLNNLSSAEEAVVRTVYLANLTLLESDIPAVRANLDTDAAAVWKHNRDEQKHRERLFDSWRRKLCGFLGIPPGPALGASGITIRV